MSLLTQKAIAHEMVDVKNKQLRSISQQLAPHGRNNTCNGSKGDCNANDEFLWSRY
jgi:hypothetical protein